MSIITLIVLKANPKLKPTFYQKVYEDNISFAYINSLYEKYFGSSIPFKEVFKSLNKNEQVFNEKLIYKEADNYLGIKVLKIVVGNDYLIPCIETGLVVFVGKKGLWKYSNNRTTGRNYRLVFKLEKQFSKII